MYSIRDRRQSIKNLVIKPKVTIFFKRRPSLKNIPIGVTDFEKIIDQNFYYVDKTLLIKSILTEKREVFLMPRPRRFGKTLNMSMLQYFFEKRDISKKYLFNDLAINTYPSCMNHQGHYPIIALSFKSVKHATWPECQSNLNSLIVDEFRRHAYLLEGPYLEDTEKQDYNSIMTYTAGGHLYQNALKHLTRYLHRYHGVKPIILIDEYDTPIHAGYTHEYYNNIIMFMRNFLCEGLKDNNNLEFAVLTGIFRVAKESIFSGLNNLYICSILDELNSAMFGFTETEVAAILEHYGLEDKKKEVSRWYNGYTFGSTTIFNPWSINNYIASHGRLDNYWVNTSSNDIIKDLFLKADSTAKEDLEQLISGTSIRKKINSNTVFTELEEHTDAIWSFLLFSGYLTHKNLTFSEQEPSVADLSIPNTEVLLLYKEIIQKWFSRANIQKKYTHIITCLTSGSIDEFAELFQDFVTESFSIFDVTHKEPERFYHAFVLGLVASITQEYEVKSNRESGYGRYDVMLIPKDITKRAVIMEFKKVNTRAKETIEQAADRALQQINDKQYAIELRSRSIANIIELAIVFDGKNLLVKQAI